MLDRCGARWPRSSYGCWRWEALKEDKPAFGVDELRVLPFLPIPGGGSMALRAIFNANAQTCHDFLQQLAPPHCWTGIIGQALLCLLGGVLADHGNAGLPRRCCPCRQPERRHAGSSSESSTQAGSPSHQSCGSYHASKIAKKPRGNSKWIWLIWLGEVIIINLPLPGSAEEQPPDVKLDEIWNWTIPIPVDTLVLKVFKTQSKPKSPSEARHLIQGGIVYLDGEKITDPKRALAREDLDGKVLQVAGRAFCRLMT